MKNLVRLSLISLIAALAACTTPPAPVKEQPPTQAALDQLQQVRDAYTAGKYGDVIRSVATSDELAAAPPNIRIEALKLQSFSYCVSKYRQLCEDGFTHILQIDPSFELAANEKGHPQWGPVFQAAKAAQAH